MPPKKAKKSLEKSNNDPKRAKISTTPLSSPQKPYEKDLSTNSTTIASSSIPSSSSSAAKTRPSTSTSLSSPKKPPQPNLCDAKLATEYFWNVGVDKEDPLLPIRNIQKKYEGKVTLMKGRKRRNDEWAQEVQNQIKSLNTEIADAVIGILTYKAMESIRKISGTEGGIRGGITKGLKVKRIFAADMESVLQEFFEALDATEQEFANL